MNNSNQKAWKNSFSSYDNDHYFHQLTSGTDISQHASDCRINNANYNFKEQFKRLTHYDDKEKVYDLFKISQISVSEEELKNSVFVIIKSTNDDDIHKSIKYGQ